MTALFTGTVAETAESLERILESRSSCRGFLPDPVPPEVLRRLFSMAQRTASWCNSQAWQVQLLDGDDLESLSSRLLARAAEGPESSDIPAPEAYEGVYAERRRTCGKALYDAVGVARDDREGRVRQMLENFRFFGVPHHAVVTTPRALGTYGTVDCGGYVATLLTAAESLGLGAVAHGAIAMYSDVVREHLGVPNDRWIVCGVSLGYADPDHPANACRTEREDVDEVVLGLPGR